ncbi:MAG: phospholipid carrier-dependent glycosyltransferase [Deltaproteobacteria bacterium]|nr:phospholipid carrier-dependent glycosyltransferase [Deltaproteobacteria bacterium]
MFEPGKRALIQLHAVAMLRSMELKSVVVKKSQVFLLLAVFLILYILPLGARDLMVPDETRYAEIPREMIANGDWVVPHLDGVRYFEKPVLGYWVHAASLLIFGENNFAVRLPSAIAVGLSAWLIYTLAGWASRDEDGDHNSVPVLAALIFLTCFEIFGVGNTAVLDSLFSFFVTASITAFYFATEAPQGTAREKQWLLLAGTACGLAFLTKGFLAFALPVMVLSPYLVWQRRHRDLWRMGWLPLFMAILVVLPWSILIYLREPDYWPFFFWNEHIRRFMTDGAQHKESFWFFFMAAPGMFMPWTFLVPAGVAGLWEPLKNQGSKGRRLVRLSICWLVLPFLFFSVSHGKLLTYILPCFPAFAILMGIGLSHALKQDGIKLFQWGIAGNGVLFTLILLAFTCVQIFGFQGFHPYSHPWKALMAANGIIFVILFCFWAFKNQLNMKKVLWFGLSPLFLFFIAHFIMPDQTITEKAPGRLLERCHQLIEPDTVVISDEDTLRAACWFLKRSDVFVLVNGGELDYGLAYPDADGRLLHLDSFSALIDRNRGKTLLVARQKSVKRWKNQLPNPVFQESSGPDGYVVWRF